MLLVEPGLVTLFTDSRYTFQARDEVRGARVHIARRGLFRAAAEAIGSARRRGTFRLAYAPNQLTVAQKQLFESSAGRKLGWVAADHLVERLRAIKDADELSRMSAAAELISDIFQRLLADVRPGVREIDLAAEIEYRIKRAGGAGPSFETIVASGARSAWAHARPSVKALGKNELVVLDQGAILRAYCSDMTRTVFLGRAPKRIRRMYNAVLEALEAAKAAVRPGVEAAKVDHAARHVLKRHGLARYFTHSTGHGVGLEVHEMPRLGRNEKTLLAEGMVVTIEPGVYVEGLGGIRIEDDVVVTSNGARVLTTASRELLEL